MASMRAIAAALVLPLVLSACGQLTLPSLPGLLSGVRGGESLALYGGAITAQGPAGYCVDGASSKAADGFAVLAPCAVLAGEGDLPSGIAVMTIQVGEAGSATVLGAEAALEPFLRAQAGRSLLSRTGDASQIRVLSTSAQANRVTVHFDDAGAPAIAGTQGDTWRAFVDLNGRLVTVSLNGLMAVPLASDEGLALLDQSIDAMLLANGAGATGKT